MDLINCLPKVLKKTEWSKTFLKKIHFVCKIRTLFMKTGRRNDVMAILTTESFAAMM